MNFKTKKIIFVRETISYTLSDKKGVTQGRLLNRFSENMDYLFEKFLMGLYPSPTAERKKLPMRNTEKV